MNTETKCPRCGAATADNYPIHVGDDGSGSGRLNYRQLACTLNGDGYD